MAASHNRIRIGTSACLIGQAVRYDGRHKAQALILDTLADRADLIPFCPEVAAGLGVPRPPVQLVAEEQGARARGVTNPQLDVTDALHQSAADFCKGVEAQGLSGFILKSRSPSCGLGSTPLHSEDGTEILGYVDGLFAEQLRVAAPWLPCVEEEWLCSQARCWRFLTACAISASQQGGATHTGLIQELRERLELNSKEMIAALLSSADQKAALDGRLAQYWSEY